MASTFIRPRDADTLLSLQAFADGISANPALYQLSAVDAASIAAAVNAYAVALGIATTPSTRTKTTVLDKDQARNAAEAICRQYANLIKYNAGISDADKQAIGVEPVNLQREARECPQTSPTIIVVAGTPGAQTLQFRDSVNPESRGKPFGATELLLWVAVGETIAASHEEARFYGKFTKNPIVVTFEPGDNGKQATYFARWAGARGDMSNWSTPATLAIAA